MDFPQNKQIYNRIKDMILEYLANFSSQKVFMIKAMKNDTIFYGYFKNVNGTINDIENNEFHDINHVVRFNKYPTIFCIQGLRPSIDIMKFPLCFTGDKLSLDSKYAFNIMNNHDIEQMIKAIKNADNLYYAVLVGSGAAVVSVLVLLGFIDSGVFNELNNRLIDIANQLAPQVVK